MSRLFILKAYAKINLGLSVVGRRPDGYHDLESVMQQVSLSDTLLFEPASSQGCDFFCTDQRLSGPDNLVNRTASLLQQKAGKALPGVKITLFKNIPVEAGLAGGSADAAAALIGLDRYWDLKLSWKELLEIGAVLGSDIPFCLHGGTALAKGRGELLYSLPPLPFFWVVLAVPENVTMPTAAAYKGFDKTKMGNPSLEPLIKAIKQGDKKGLMEWLARGFTNTLETAMLPGSDSLQHIKARLKEFGFIPVLSGSGPTIFVLTENYRHAREAARVVEQESGRAYICWVTGGNRED